MREMRALDRPACDSQCEAIYSVAGSAAWLCTRLEGANDIRSVVPMVADEKKRILVLRARAPHEQTVELPA